MPLGFSYNPVMPPSFLKGHHWSVCMKLNQAAVSQRKVILMVAAEERETVAAGGALHVFTSNIPFTFKLTD